MEIDIREPLNETNETESKWGQNPVTIQVDNQGGMDLAANPKHHDRMKYIDIRYHFIQEAVEKRYIRLA